jgi:hypothetical protein
MSQQNLISLDLSDSDVTEIGNAIKTIQNKLLPMLKSLSPEDKKELQKMGDKTYAFVEKCHDYAKQNPELVPAFLDMEEFGRDLESYKKLRSFFNPINQISGSIEDSMTLCGSDSQSASMIFYNSVKAAAKSNVLKSKSIYDDLSSRFPGRPKKETPGT